MFVRCGPQGVRVRSSRLPNGQKCVKSACRFYPYCRNGDMCRFAHGKEELKYWRGKHGIVEDTAGILSTMNNLSSSHCLQSAAELIHQETSAALLSCCF